MRVLAFCTLHYASFRTTENATKYSGAPLGVGEVNVTGITKPLTHAQHLCTNIPNLKLTIYHSLPGSIPITGKIIRCEIMAS